MRRLAPLLVAVLTIAHPAAADAEPESAVKAAFLFKFLSYVEWPRDSFAAPASPIVVGVIDSHEVASALAEIVTGRSAQGRPVEVRTLKPGDPVAGIQMVFVGKNAAGALAKLPHADGLLVVGESDDALDRGAMINLLRVGDHVRFQVAPEAAERRGLHISSRMLALAQHAEAR